MQRLVGKSKTWLILCYDLDIYCRYSEEVCAFHLNTSAKTNEGVEELFLNLTNRMLDFARVKEQQAAHSQGTSTNGRQLQITDEEPTQSSSRGCCG